jgi:hypothetical protein
MVVVGVQLFSDSNDNRTFANLLSSVCLVMFYLAVLFYYILDHCG